MKNKIAIITSAILKDFIIKSLADEFNSKCEFYIYSFGNNLSKISNIYDNLPHNIDGIFSSGVFIEKYIKETYPNNKIPIISLKNDDTGIYKLFYNLIKNNRNLDISRIYADPFTGIGLSLEEYLDNDTGKYSDLLKEKLESFSIEEISEFEKKQYNKHIDLWEKGLIDISITRLGNLFETLPKKGIPTYFLYPSVNYVKSCMIQLIQQIKIRRIENSKPAIINITLKKNYSVDSNFDRDNILLQNSILEFNNNSLVDYIIQKTRFGFEIFTDKKTIQEKTQDYKNCLLGLFLSEKLNFDINIGYGIGQNIYQARMNAIDANRESSIDKLSSSYLITEDDNLINLTRGDINQNVSNELIDNLKKEKNIKLSPITIKKIIYAFNSMENGQITAKDLSYKLNITLRSANRFLSIMEESNAVKIIKTKKNTTKGRPERVYELCID